MSSLGIPTGVIRKWLTESSYPVQALSTKQLCETLTLEVVDANLVGEDFKKIVFKKMQAEI